MSLVDFRCLVQCFGQLLVVDVALALCRDVLTSGSSLVVHFLVVKILGGEVEAVTVCSVAEALDHNLLGIGALCKGQSLVEQADTLGDTFVGVDQLDIGLERSFVALLSGSQEGSGSLVVAAFLQCSQSLGASALPCSLKVGYRLVSVGGSQSGIEACLVAGLLDLAADNLVLLFCVHAFDAGGECLLVDSSLFAAGLVHHASQLSGVVLGNHTGECLEGGSSHGGIR